MSKQEIITPKSHTQEQVDAGKDTYKAIKRERRLGKLAVVNAVVLGVGSVMFGANSFNAETPRDAAISGIVSGFMAASALATNSTRHTHALNAIRLEDENDEVLGAYYDSEHQDLNK